MYMDISSARVVWAAGRVWVGVRGVCKREKDGLKVVEYILLYHAST